MTHRVHPKALRIKKIEDWDSRGFYQKDAAKLLEEDFKIRQFLREKLSKAGIEKIEIERFPNKINVIVSASRPGLIIGRRGEEVERLKKELEGELIKRKDLSIQIQPVKEIWLSASLAAQWVAQQIENRVSYRRVLKQAIQKIMSYKGARGARVEVAGRLGGTEIARREWLKVGRLPRQTIRANIDYADGRAYCTYGIIGIKIWIYKGEEF